MRKSTLIRHCSGVTDSRSEKAAYSASHTSIGNTRAYVGYRVEIFKLT